MKRKLLATFAGMTLSGWVLAQPGWLIDSDTTLEQARKARRNDVSAAQATTDLIGFGRDPAQAVQSVAQVYSNCDAMRSSVETGARLAPADAQAIVEAVNALPCLCAADSVWPDMRLESRIRPETRRMSVALAPAAVCSAAAAEAAVKGAPDRASDILRGAIGSGRGGTVADSVGQVGGSARSVEQQQLLRRDLQKADGCVADVEISDEFRPDQRFEQKAMAAEVVATQAPRCEGAMDVMIDGVASAMTANTAIVLRNDTSDVIDLAAGGYAVEVYFAGSDVPGRKIALEGSINPGGVFVVASPEAESEVRGMANLVTPSVRVSPGDSVVLRRGIQSSDCRGVATAMATIANAMGGAAGQAWLDGTRSEYEGAAPSMQAVDAIGQAGVPAEAWQGAMAGQPMTLKRENDMCQGDLNPADSFGVVGGWQAVQGVEPADLGNAAPRCAAPSADLVISQYASAGDDYRAVEVLNNTSGDVDLGRAGYVLEIYADGATTPSRTVALDGKLPVGQALVVANSDAPPEVRERSQVVTADLDLDRINALVLRKTGIVSGRACAAEAIAASRDIGSTPISIALANPLVPSREPSNDDTLIGNGSGGELASPN